MGLRVVRRTICHMHSVSSEASALPDKAALFGQEGWYFPADELVRDRLLAVGINLVCVLDFPGAAGCAVVVGHGLFGR